MPDYQQMSGDEVLRLVLEKDQLTDEARVALEAEVARRGLSHDDFAAFKAEEATATRAREKEVHEVSLFNGIEKKLRGRSNYKHDPRFRIEEFDTTLWVVLFWVPVVPLGTFRIRRTFRRWWTVCASDRYRVLDRLPRIGSRFSLRGSKRQPCFWPFASRFLFSYAILCIAEHPPPSDRKGCVREKPCRP